MTRAEQLKKLLSTVVQGAVVKQIIIREGDTGYGYETVFGKYLNNDVTMVQLEEPYIREHYQILNLLRFCELLAMRCGNLQLVLVTTIKDERPNADQTTAFEAIAKSLMDTKRAKMEVRFSENLHDRQIM